MAAHREKKGTGFHQPFQALPKALVKERGKEKPAPKAPLTPQKQDGSEEDDTSLFLQAMHGVVALDSATPLRIEPAKNLESQLPTDDELALAEFESFARGDLPFSQNESEEFISGIAPGVTHTLLQALSRGDFAYRRHLDLHGLSREDAHGVLANFIKTARHNNERCVLVITGRGKSSPLGQSVLREALPRWLSRAPIRAHVLAYCTAKQAHGGPGAFYVLLRRLGQRPYGVSS